MCLIDDGDYEGRFLQESHPRARKPHRCDECHRTIEHGEQYHRAVFVTDGDLCTWRLCAHCAAGADLLMQKCGGYLFGGVLDDLNDHVHPTIPWRMKAARCVVGMQRKWQRFDGRGLMPTPQAWDERPLQATLRWEVTE